MTHLPDAQASGLCRFGLGFVLNLDARDVVEAANDIRSTERVAAAGRQHDRVGASQRKIGVRNGVGLSVIHADTQRAMS